ncbi:hypothetical protein D5876_01440 [Salmonella enterica subsp. enterica serovar Carno]|uniref:Uncharacterized protein n=3 Tax=Salmonella enterica TaxID=28901 RepID=A0A748KH32_SALER|nr:hypothetical protein [Salmonella enterica subsp. enterica serovar Idikan]EAA5430720.1 hypothetical protein [Salmonella enterica subsp. enterica serovar Falkensee]EAM9755487.1 hypothetical protein [Salmonella enterica]EAW1949620.1 hypothetical protein [Salmonella enterica subsp. enterica]EBS0649281.1 hypothetical protein [Salmonella enterica subsp. enterica serovar Yolo]EBS0848811.1 hypothetical protein [Salmonella enterica subsp. enterica serovar Carno]EBU8263004.1 hypothetical protein [Sa
MLTSLIFSITHASSSLNKKLSLLNENLLKEKIISLNIFCSISIYSRINVRRWRKNLMSRNIDSQQITPVVMQDT